MSSDLREKTNKMLEEINASVLKSAILELERHTSILCMALNNEMHVSKVLMNAGYAEMAARKVYEEALRLAKIPGELRGNDEK